MSSLRSLLPSVLLILIYFITDEFFGPVAGVICAIILGTVEFTYTRIREKRNDKIIIVTTLFFCIPGAITILSAGSVLAELQPGIVEAALCSLLGIFAFSNTDLTATLPASYRKTANIIPAQQKAMKNTLKILFFILCAHTALVFVVILHPDTAGTASFIKGPLLYLLIGLFFAGILARNRLLIKRRNHEEWLPVVNEKGEVTGKAPRSLCHSGSKLLHPVVHLHITNSKKELFLQKRSIKKDLLPGMWDTAVGGHIGINEKIEDALKRETREELGITDFEAKFIGSYLWESQHEKELVFSFLCTRYNTIKIDNDEVDEGRFWSRQEIEKGIYDNLLTPNFIHEYQTIIKKLLA